jgi:diguanylate cyclase (GGDEF)-like protein
MTDQYGLFITNLRLRITDPLTGLYNRIYIRESLEKEISQFSHCGIMMTDFDDFRNFNQTHGSDAGDMILQKFIESLKKNMRNQDIICRYGDDEFILIMPELSLSETGKRAEQLRSEIAENFSMKYDEKILNITTSFGVVSFPEHGSNINDVLNAASKALNRAKAGGKNRIVVL